MTRKGHILFLVPQNDAFSPSARGSVTACPVPAYLTNAMLPRAHSRQPLFSARTEPGPLPSARQPGPFFARKGRSARRSPSHFCSMNSSTGTDQAGPRRNPAMLSTTHSTSASSSSAAMAGPPSAVLGLGSGGGSARALPRQPASRDRRALPRRGAGLGVGGQRAALMAYARNQIMALGEGRSATTNAAALKDRVETRPGVRSPLHAAPRS